MALTQMPKSLKLWTLYVDGVGYAGRVKEGTIPKIALKTYEYQGGGMVGAVDISTGTIQKIEFDFTLGEVNPTVIGLLDRDDVAITFRGAQGTTNEAIIIETRGLIREADPGSWKSGEEATLKISATAKYYKMTVAGSNVVEIDIENMVFKRNGVDLLAAVRSALGL